MKRIIAFLILAALGCALTFAGEDSFFIQQGLERVTFVSKQLCEFEEDAEVKIIQSGNHFYISTSPENAQRVGEKLSQVSGYVLYYDKTIDKEELLSALLDFRGEESIVEGTKVVTGYTSHFKDFRVLNGKKVNVQIAFTEDNIVVGFPLILTGF